MKNLSINKDGKTCLHHHEYGDNNLVGIIDEDDNWVIEPKFDDAFEFNKGKRQSGFARQKRLYSCVTTKELCRYLRK